MEAHIETRLGEESKSTQAQSHDCTEPCRTETDPDTGACSRENQEPGWTPNSPVTSGPVQIGLLHQHNEETLQKHQQGVCTKNNRKWSRCTNGLTWSEGALQTPWAPYLHWVGVTARCPGRLDTDQHHVFFHRDDTLQTHSREEEQHHDMTRCPGSRPHCPSGSLPPGEGAGDRRSDDGGDGMSWHEGSSSSCWLIQTTSTQSVYSVKTRYSSSYRPETNINVKLHVDTIMCSSTLALMLHRG